MSYNFPGAPRAYKTPNTMLQGFKVVRQLKLRRFRGTSTLINCKVGTVVQFKNGRRSYKVMQQNASMTGLIALSTGKSYIVTGAKRMAIVSAT